MMDEEDGALRSLVIQYLLAHTRCSGCGRQYGPDDMHVRARRGDVWLAAVTCRHCGQQGLIMAAIRIGDAGEQEPAAGGEIKDEAAQECLAPISSDEVLDWHCFLEQFRGDVHQLFGEGTSGDEN